MIKINLLKSKGINISQVSELKKQKIESSSIPLKKKKLVKEKRKIVKGLGVVVLLAVSFLLIDRILFSESSENKNLKLDSNKLIYHKMKWGDKINYQIAFYNKILPLFSGLIKSNLIWDTLSIQIPNQIAFKGSFFKGEKNKSLYDLISLEDLKILKSERYRLGELVQGFVLNIEINKLYILGNVNRVYKKGQVSSAVERWKDLIKVKSLKLREFKFLENKRVSNLQVSNYSVELEAKEYQDFLYVIQEMFLGYSKVGMSRLIMVPVPQGIKIRMLLTIVSSRI